MTDTKHPSDEALTRFERTLFSDDGPTRGDVFVVLRAARDRNALECRVAELESECNDLAAERDAYFQLKDAHATLTRLAKAVVEAAEAVPTLYAEEEDLPKAVSLRDAHLALRAALSTTPPPPDKLRELATAVVEHRDSAFLVVHMDALAALLGKGE